QMVTNSRRDRGISGYVTAGLRAIAHQSWRVRQKKPHPANDGLLQSLCHGVPLRLRPVCNGGIILQRQSTAVTTLREGRPEVKRKSDALLRGPCGPTRVCP